MALVILPRQYVANINGVPRVGAYMRLYDAGTDNTRVAYTTIEYSVELEQPIRSTEGGFFPAVQIKPDGGNYKILIQDEDGAVVYSEDNLVPQSDALTSELIATTLDSLKRSPAEIAAGVTPANYAYPPLYVDRYGTNAAPGATSMAAAFQAAIDVAKVAGGTIRFGATRNYLIDAPLDLTIPGGASNAQKQSFSIEGESLVTAVTIPPSAAAPTLIFKHTGHAFDCAGTYGLFFRNMSITTDSLTYPKTCFFIARSSDGESMQCRFNNVMIIGSFSVAPYYLYGSEETVWVGCQTFNRASDANAKCFIFTQNNIRSLSSTFITIATGSQSSLGYALFGCSSAMTSHHATADVFEIDAASEGRIFGGWAACADGTGGGRSIVYVNTTNGMGSNWSFNGFHCEASAPTPVSYGVLFGTETSGGGSNWSFVNCAFPHATRIIGGGHASGAIAGLTMINLSSKGVGTGGVNFAGSLIAPIDGGVEGAIVAGSISQPNTHKVSLNVQAPSDAYIGLRDDGAGADAKALRIRSASGQFVITLLDDNNTPVSTALSMTRSGTTPTLWDFTGATGANFARVGFNGTANIAKPTVTGSKGANAALTSLLSVLASYGLITDSTS